MKFILKYKYSISGLFVGAMVGYGYYAFVGCKTGTCAITSSPVNSTLYFAVLGALIVNTFNTNRASTGIKSQTQESDNT